MKIGQFVKISGFNSSVSDLDDSYKYPYHDEF